MADNGEGGKRDGMGRVDDNADEHWKACALESLKEVARRKQYFDVEDAKRWCMKEHPNAKTHDDRAWGPVMRRGAKLGYCVQTDQWNKSTWASCHRRPMQLWFSLIYGGLSPLPKPRRRKVIDPRQIAMDV